MSTVRHWPAQDVEPWVVAYVFETQGPREHEGEQFDKPSGYTRLDNSKDIQRKYSRTALMQINWDGEPSGYAENREIGFFFVNRLYWQIEVGLLVFTA
jgi:hypothetical protein